MRLTINFASQHRYRQRYWKRLCTLVILILTVVLVFQVRQFLVNYRLEKTYQQHLITLEQQLQGENVQQLDGQRLESLKRDYAAAEKLIRQDAFRWTLLFDRIEALLPDGISLRGFNPDYEKNILVLNGVSRDLGSLQMLLDNLHAENFKDAFLLQQSEVSLTDRRGRERTGLSFSINLTGVF